MVYVSVILPTFNRGFVIENFIKSLFNQTYKDWELIIVDDNSHDNTVEILAKYKESTKIHLHKLETHKGLPAARNIGVALARGTLVFFGEDDITFSNSDVLRILVETFDNLSRNFSVGAIGPRIKGNGGYTWINNVVEIGPLTGNVYSNFDYNPRKLVEVPNLHSCSLISRNYFYKVGGFDEKLYTGTHAKEEVDFYFRMSRSGYKLFFQPATLIFHNHALVGGCEARKKLRVYFFELRNTLLF